MAIIKFISIVVFPIVFTINFFTINKESQVTTLPSLSAILPCSMESLSIRKDSLSNPYSLSSSDLFQSLSKSPLLTARLTFILSLSLLQS